MVPDSPASFWLIPNVSFVSDGNGTIYILLNEVVHRVSRGAIDVKAEAGHLHSRIQVTMLTKAHGDLNSGDWGCHCNIRH